MEPGENVCGPHTLSQNEYHPFTFVATLSRHLILLIFGRNIPEEI